jgi:mannosyl-3-phosphoglycerate phosphatase family protein
MSCMSITAPIVVVTDLDGTLLDHDTYEPGPAAAKVTALTDAGVTVVCCSAKTRAEQQVHRRDLGLTGRFVIENGAAVHDDNGPVHVLGLSYDEVRDRLSQAGAALGVTLRGFGDMAVDEVAARTGLSAPAAARARDRYHTEPFLVVDDSIDEPTLRVALGAVDLGLQRGARFWTASGHHDKGAAVGVLRELFTVDHGERPLIYGLGDTYNDAAMLAAVDIAMLVQRPDGTWADLDVENVTRLDGVGPSGWIRAADIILATVTTT